MSTNARPGPHDGPGRDQHTTKRAGSVVHRIPWGKFEWRVRYRRVGWGSVHSRLYQSEPPTRRFVDKLLDPRPGDRTLVLLELDHRSVGPWVTVDVLIGEPEELGDSLADEDGEGVTW